jgi:hypothetical protein
MGSTPTVPELRVEQSQSAWLGVSGSPSWDPGVTAALSDIRSYVQDI